MKSPNLSICAGTVLLCCAAASLIPEATNAAEDWSTPVQISIPSDGGVITVLKQTVEHCGYPIDLLYSQDGSSVWIGESQQAYFDVKGQIWGGHAVGRNLLFTPPVPALSGTAIASIADNWLELRRTGTEPKPDPRFNLTFVFGASAFGGGLRAMSGPTFTISRVTPTSTNISFNLRATSGNDLGLTFSPDWNLISATKNGVDILPMLDGKFPLDQQPWSPRSVTLQSTTGPVTATAYDTPFDGEVVTNANFGAITTERIPYAPNVQVLVLPSGDLWIGPSPFAKLAMMNGKILGFIPSRQTGELLVFVGPRKHIPMEDGKRIAAFRKVLDEVEAQVATNKLIPDKIVKLSSLFNDDPNFANDSEILVRGIAFEGTNLVVNLRSLKGNLVIKFTPDLEILTAERATQ
jgi:hypothetical protein